MSFGRGVLSSSTGSGKAVRGPPRSMLVQQSLQHGERLRPSLALHRENSPALQKLYTPASITCPSIVCRPSAFAPSLQLSKDLTLPGLNPTPHAITNIDITAILPSLPTFIDSAKEDATKWMINTRFTPNKRKAKRKHGFLARLRTANGRRILRRRMRKNRARLAL